MLQPNLRLSLYSRKNKLLATLSLIGFVGFLPAISFAQVNVNQSALDHLGPAHNKKQTKSTKQSLHPSQQHNNKTKPKPAHNQHIKTNTPPKAQPATPAVLPTIPNAPPPIPVFKDANITVPLHPPAPPPMPKVNPKENGRVVVTNKDTILVYESDNVDLNEPMMKAVMDFADNLKQHQEARVVLNAYSHDIKDDPSTPRRIALNRGLAIRSVLINQGIPSTRIYLLAKGVPPQPLKDIGDDYVEIIRSDFAPTKLKSPAPHQ